MYCVCYFFVCGAIMEQLPTKEQEKIRKMSDTRLTSFLTKAGVTLDELEAMNRSQMIERWAQIVVTGGISTPPSGNPAKIAGGYDVALERERLAFEKQKWEAELSLERAKLEAQKEERERLASESKAKEEKEFAERQNRFVAEDKFREQQLILQAEQIKLERERRETKVSQLKHYGDAIRNSVSKLK